ncbi:Imm59 family immunity protein [Virgibacillus sp. C22-A2]|uniref:Imm59 family immunity protein n=1 Tax=Virgibacillus tibetensis TaxID=3042313 RepID=A0ABU6KIM4_9BACI|nr:Imm59 family immunity protein [Virgibacillus sp. C22-A2]
MTRDEAKKIIVEEGLKQIIWFGNHKLKENEVGIKYEDNQWEVYVTDERANIVTGSITKFVEEDKALDNFIARARTEKNLFR